eukprot:gene1024-346_t
MHFMQIEISIKHFSDVGLGNYTVNSTKGVWNVASEKCTCDSFFTMRLPCRHIFALRKQLQHPLYFDRLCDKRWTKSYYRNSHRVFKTNKEDSPEVAKNDDDLDNILPITIRDEQTQTRKVLSQHEKYRKAFAIAQKLASVSSEIPIRQFNSHLDVLKTILSAWEEEKHVIVNAIIPGEEETDNQPLERTTFQENKIVQNENVVPIDDGNAETKLDVTVDDEEMEFVSESGEIKKSIDNVKAEQDMKTSQGQKALSEIKLSPKMKQRGRPRGLQLTAVGLPTKKPRKESKAMKPKLFKNKSALEKEQYCRMNSKWRSPYGCRTDSQGDKENNFELDMVNAEPCIEKVDEAEKTGNEVICSLMINKMAIRKNISWDGSKFRGYVDIGNGIQDESSPVAKDALVFMVVNMNGSWYTYTKLGILVLGASLKLLNLNPSFPHPSKKSKKVHVLHDICHMLILVRNTSANNGVLLDKDDKQIEWQYLENLQNVKKKKAYTLVTRNPFAKGFKPPIRASNKRIKSTRALFHDLVEIPQAPMKYLLMYKFSQDNLELFLVLFVQLEPSTIIQQYSNSLPPTNGF